MIKKVRLLHLYKKEKLSVPIIAKRLHCSEHKVNYWLAKHNIKKRNISDAVYQFHNPNGDPFVWRTPRNINQAILYGLGLGLYWGEGTKRGRGSVKLGNTDVHLIQKFIAFLHQTCSVKKDKLKFGLQIFSDIDPSEARRYWMHELRIKEDQFYKIIISKVRGSGTYKYKSQYGVLSVYFHNIRLKQLICQKIDTL